jgi:hypothetical protein
VPKSFLTVLTVSADLKAAPATRAVRHLGNPVRGDLFIETPFRDRVPFVFPAALLKERRERQKDGILLSSVCKQVTPNGVTSGRDAQR